MKKFFLFIYMIAIVGMTMAHDAHYDRLILRDWYLPKEHKNIKGSFYIYKDNKVFIEDMNAKILSIPFSSLCDVDRSYVIDKYQKIVKINSPINESDSSLNGRFIFAIILLLCFSFFLFSKANQSQKKFLFPVLLVGIISTFYAFTQKMMKTTTDPNFINLAFAPFKPDVNTRWDNNYFYVESKGIPQHLMMAGITGWQQQFPIPQCYIGNNAWSIPLNPTKATNPVPVNQQHFLRGAIAIAANGIAIFNPYTNTGVDALLDGQLDNFGGHCGRADDYHYHNAPMFLDDKTTDVLPIAFALDGYAVYASLEPDGSPMMPLDANHGHDGSNGVYHYHGTKTAPYMIGNMVGKVTEDSTLQIIPQASAKPVRPSGTPLKGAVITSCIPNSLGNGYTLTYTLNGATDSVEYSWTPAGAYTFNYYVSGVKTTSNYKGTAICTVPSTSSINQTLNNEKFVRIYPNPSSSILNIQLDLHGINDELKQINLYSLKGEKVYSSNKYERQIDIKSLPPGIYLVNICFDTFHITKKIIID